MMNFDKEMKDRAEWVEEVLKEYLPTDECRQSIIMDAMTYSVEAGGKRIRPVLMCEVAKMYGLDKDKIRAFAAVIEFIHTYSLIHDDLPAMDNDEYRRGRKTTHIVYGEAMGILAGDALLNYAYETGMNAVLRYSNVLYAAKALQLIAKKAGIYGMVGGQTIDVLSEGKSLDRETLDYINELKTGGLIEASMMTGAVLAGACDEDVKAIELAASKIGLAFQIQDDILDIISTTEELGKPVHSDEKNSKSTYVNLIGIDNSRKEVQRLSNDAINILQGLGQNNEFLIELIRWLTNRSK